jgi:hypothetical protein
MNRRLSIPLAILVAALATSLASRADGAIITSPTPAVSAVQSQVSTAGMGSTTREDGSTSRDGQEHEKEFCLFDLALPGNCTSGAAPTPSGASSAGAAAAVATIAAIAIQASNVSSTCVLESDTDLPERNPTSVLRPPRS